MTNKAYIFYENHLATPLLASIITSSARTGYSVENCYDWRTTTYWSPNNTVGYHSFTATFSSPITVDYLAFYRHNLESVNGNFYIMHSIDNLVWNTVLYSTATDNELKIITFTAITAQYWRVVFYIPTTTPFFLGVVMIGRRMPLDRGMVAGFTIPRHGRKNDIVNQRTEGGQFVGRVKTSQGARSSINFRHVTQSWVRSYWEAFVEHAELLPFLFSWNHDTYPQDAVYCVTDGEIPDISINDNHHHDINLPVQCLLSGDTL